MRTPKTLKEMTVNFSWSRPTFWSAEDDDRPEWTERFARVACLLLVLFDFQDASLHSGSHCLMHSIWIATLDKVRCPTIANKESLELPMADTGQKRGVIDLISIQMKNRKHCTISDRVKELGAMPTCGKRTSLRLAVSYHSNCNQIRIIEDSSKCVRD